MKENKISIELSLADIDAIHQVLVLLSEKLQPLLISLETENRQSFVNLCEKQGWFNEKSS